jgi:hypothetical protein
MNRTTLSLSLLAALAAACGGTTEDDPSAPLTLVATAPAGALNVELLTRAPGLATGMTPVYLRVTNASGQTVTDADVTFTPEMAMSGGPTHSAPVIGAPAPGADGLYHVDVVFQMASSMMGSWRAVASVTPPAGAIVEAAFPSLAVADSGRARTFTHFDPDAVTTTKYVASLNFAAAPRVGLNPVVATLHRMQDMMTFVPVEDAALRLEPWMPSMAHGSPGSVDPSHTTLGRYAGELSFSMPGEWETTLTISRGGATLGTPRFTTTF